MAVIRISKTTNYTVMSNYHLKDKKLSLRAKGLLSVMLSLPDNWDYSVNGLVAICNEGISVIRKILKELEENRYLVRKRLQDKSGKFEYEYIIYEKPHTVEPHIEKPHTVEQLQLNTNKLSTKESNTKNNNIIYSEMIEKIMNYLNNCGMEEPNLIHKEKFNYNPKASSNTKLLTARIKEGYTLEQFEKAIYYAYHKFIDNEFTGINGKSSKQYYRPSTIFAPTNFDNYVNEYEKKWGE